MLKSTRALDQPSLPAHPSACDRAATGAEEATQDQPGSSNIFNIFTGPYTVRMLLLPRARLSYLACTHVPLLRLRSIDPYTPRRRSTWRMLKAVRIGFYLLSHDHCALQINWWGHSSCANGFSGAA